MPHASGIGAIFGIVSENGIAKVGGRVGLYDRSTMQLLSKTVADALGGYVFNGLNQNTNDYLVMALDDDGTPAKNALVQDYIQPIPAHMGATFPGNWWFLAMQRNPLGLIVPRFDGSPSRAVPGVTPYPYWNTADGTGSFEIGYGMAIGSWLSGLAPITPGAPHLPTTQLTSARLGFPGRHVGDTAFFDSPTSEFTLEWVLDASVSGALQYCRHFSYPSSNANVTFGVIAMKWDRAANKLSAAIVSNDTWYNNPNNNIDFTNSSLWRGHTQYTNSGITNAAHHFVWAVRMGVEGKLYIDGTLVATTSLSGETPLPPAPNKKAGFYLSGIGTNPTLGTCTTGPFACYPVRLTQTQVTAHYNALMVGSSPLVTGYIRDVVMDEPSMIYRCAAAGPGTENEYLSNANPVTYYGTLTFAQSSAVTGGSMVLFGGGTANNTFSGGQLGYQQYTIEFWVNPTTAAPPATRTIMAGRGPDESTIIWRLNQLITTGKLEMYHRNSTGTYETIVFNYTPVASTTVLVAIVVDKVNAVAKVYENGVLKDTQSVLTGYLDVIYLDYNNESTWNYKYLHIGGFRTAGGTISQAFFGKLGEITFYTRALTPDRLLSHYDSRTLI